LCECTDVYIVSHTHWDREWYLPYQRFRANLARIMDGVLAALEGTGPFADAGPFEHFLLDGQAIILEDYLAVAPENAERIRGLVAAGRLSIGPWFVLPDEFLISAEAHVRNLLIGHQICAAFEGAQKVGYMPDSFGHIAQMPQILRQAGIDSFVYTRGDGDEIDRLGNEYIWQAPDGSEVLAIHQCGGYCNAGALGYAEIWEAHTQRAVDVPLAVHQAGELLARMAPLSNGPLRLFNNGCDHFPVQAEFGAILAALREEFPRITFHHTSLSDYIRAVQAAGSATKRHTGELLGGKHHPSLSGVWSARMPLKQQNDEAQTLLAQVVEPLAAYMNFTYDRPYPLGVLRATWKLLLENHPHDSICGCSTDEVHREMLTRFAGVVQAGEQLVVQALTDLAPTVAGRREDDHQIVLVVFNPLPERRTEVIERLVVLPPGTPDRELILRDGAGQAVAYQVLDRQRVERFWNVDYRREPSAERQRQAFDVYRRHFGQRILKGARSPDERGDREDGLSEPVDAGVDTHLWIQFLAEDLPALGHRIYALEASPAGDRAAGGASGAIAARPTATSPAAARPPAAMRRQGNTVENAYLRATLHPNGVIDLLDKSTGREYRGLNLLDDRADAGDEYDYSAAEETDTFTSADAQGVVRVVTETALTVKLEAESQLVLPLALEADRRRRSWRRTSCPFRVGLTVQACSPIVEVETDFDNRVADHRLRALFPTPIQTPAVISEGHFLVQSRPVVQPAGEDWVQPPSGTYPQQGYCLVEDSVGGLAILNRGLPEFASLAPGPVAAGTGLALTLLRCVGWLSRDDFASRRRKNAGPTLYTPEAQCPGPGRYRYALVAYAGSWLAAGIPAWSQRYRVPVIVNQGVRDGHILAGAGLLEKSSPSTVITAVKKHEQRESLIVRLYNMASEVVTERLVFGMPVESAWQVDLLEERTGVPMAVEGDQVRLSLGPHAIMTVEVAFA